MGLPIVAIVGRPNVGKSSLLNALVGRRISIVDPTPGVTRDRVSAVCALRAEQRGGYVELVDTGGMGLEDTDRLAEHVTAQIAYAVSTAALILFVVDAREGVTPLDRRVAERLRRQDRPVVLVANKIDQADAAAETAELFRLGFGEPVCVSAAHATGLADLMAAAGDRLGDVPDRRPDAAMKLAVVGKRNAGKSTFINTLVGQPRVIVSETPGTTRDSVDVACELDARPFVLIDTAGARKRRSLADDIEFYSRHRALRSIRRADVVALLVDAAVPVSQVDKHLAGEIVQQYKPVVLVVNKWDLAADRADGESYQDYLLKSFPELAFAPIALTSATEGLNVRETIRLAEQLFRQAKTRVGTGELNRFVQEIQGLRGPSHKAGTRPPKIYYASQIGVAPPTIVCVVNDVRSFDAGWQRFFRNRLRKRVPFAEVPIRLLLRQRGKRTSKP
jgi:GTP-binding protein